jgi:hypothetical protein
MTKIKQVTIYQLRLSQELYNKVLKEARGKGFSKIEVAGYIPSLIERGLKK